ncbi:MAG: hypothetical protein DMD85_06720 [Candidatus Rokuibacteriota bacterium]|nr:MAG: hypothetical protein DMD85_06720 [Candidatus Rokubacteria bacterium]
MLGTTRLRALRRVSGLLLARSLGGGFQFFPHAHRDRRMTELVRSATALAVIIRAAGGDETMGAAEVLVVRRLRRRVLGVDRLDAQQPRLDQLGNERVAIRQPGMREDRNAARAAN